MDNSKQRIYFEPTQELIAFPNWIIKLLLSTAQLSASLLALFGINSVPCTAFFNQLFSPFFHAIHGIRAFITKPFSFNTHQF